MASSRLGVLAGLAAFFALMSSKPASAEPLPKPLERWKVALFLNPPIRTDDGTLSDTEAAKLAEIEDAIRNGIVKIFGQTSGTVQEYAPIPPTVPSVPPAYQVANVLVDYQGTPGISTGASFALPNNTTATVLSVTKMAATSV